jgi:hypothetical protein
MYTKTIYFFVLITLGIGSFSCKSQQPYGMENLTLKKEIYGLGYRQ